MELAREEAAAAQAAQRLRVAARHVATLADPLLGVALVLGLLELLSRTDVFSHTWLPPVSSIFAELFHQLVAVHFWTAVGHTLQSWSLALGLDCAIGITVGISMGTSEVVHRALRPIVEFMRPLPSVALIPFAVLMLGRTEEMKVLLVVLGSVWPMLLQTLYGLRDVDPVAMDTARSFGLDRRARLLRVTLPSMAPYLATGVRITASLALLIDVITELVGGGFGLGNEISLYQQGGLTVTMYSYMLSVGLLGWTINIALSTVEKRVLHWHPSRRVVEK